MRLKFLSDEWLAELTKTVAEAGDIEVSPELQNLVLNVNISSDEFGNRELNMNKGVLGVGHVNNAAATLNTTAELAERVLIDKDNGAAMQGFMSGQIKVDGDMAQLMALQTAVPTPAQEEIGQKIADFTA